MKLKLILSGIILLNGFISPPTFAQWSTTNCGIKPIPQLGYEIGRCVNGQWEQVSSSKTTNSINCGIKPIPQLGYKIGRCVNGRWEQVSQ